MIYDKQGGWSTKRVAGLAVDTARERGIEHIVIASNTGDTAREFIGCGKRLVCVTHAQGFKEHGQNEMDEDTRVFLEKNGVRVYTGTHVLSGVERGISRGHGGMYPAEMIAHSLRMLGQGVKVCVEISIMALDAGLIPYGEAVMAVGGRSRGADTAVILTPAHANAVFDTRIHRVVCKPW